MKENTQREKVQDTDDRSGRIIFEIWPTARCEREGEAGVSEVKDTWEMGDRGPDYFYGVRGDGYFYQAECIEAFY